MGLFSRTKRGGFTDEAAYEDFFGIDKYIQGLSDFILECDTPMTISIQGAWGCGKTSLMQMVQQRIKDKVLIINFNTWQFSQFDLGNMLPFSMLQVMMRSLGGENFVSEKLYAGIKNISRFVAGTAAKTLAGVELDSFGSHGMVSEDLASEISNLKQKLKMVIDEKLSSSSVDRVVIFVDDLDRLQPQRAVELLEVLKLFLDCKGCVFVLAIDSEVVFRGVSQKYNFGENDHKRCQYFFDKIIQVPFIMPVASYDMNKYIGKCLEEINISNSADEVEHFAKFIRYSIGTNPRAIKRLLNSYLLLTKISPENVGSILLFAVMCMQYLSPELYNFIVSNRMTLTAADFVKLVSAKDEDLEQLEEDHDADLSFMKSDNEDDELSDKISMFLNELSRLISSDHTVDHISEEDFNKLRNVLGAADSSVLNSDVSMAAPKEDKESSSGRGKRQKIRIVYNGRTYKNRKRLVTDIVYDYVNAHPGISSKELREAFPDDLQGSLHVIRSVEEAQKYSYGDVQFTLDNPLELSDGKFAVCRVWMNGAWNNFKRFTDHVVQNLGIELDIKSDGQAEGDEEESQDAENSSSEQPAAEQA